MNDSAPHASPKRIELDRRTLLGGGAAAAALACAPSASLGAAPQSGSAPASREPRSGHPVLVGSQNALAGMQRFYQRLQEGADPLDVAIEVVKLQEADPADSSVGYGGLPNERGVVQLDAACMYGPTHNSGAVAALENIKHPSMVARLVMERTDHCLLVGQGAYDFARAHGFPHEELLTEESRKKWLRWKERASEDDDWLAPAAEKRTGRLGGPGPDRLAHAEPPLEHTWGTVHCSALSVRGELACTTTTSGLSWKIPGRVGDSPIVGAGLYCDQEAGSAGGTGRGEAAILANGSFAIVERMRQGASAEEAGLEVLARIVRQVKRQAKWQPALMGADDKPAFDLNFYVLALDGTWAGVTLKGSGRFAVADPEKGARLEPLKALA